LPCSQKLEQDLDAQIAENEQLSVKMREQGNVLADKEVALKKAEAKCEVSSS
jgi:hypothetical protein